MCGNASRFLRGTKELFDRISQGACESEGNGSGRGVISWEPGSQVRSIGDRCWDVCRVGISTL